MINPHKSSADSIWLNHYCIYKEISPEDRKWKTLNDITRVFVCFLFFFKLVRTTSWKTSVKVVNGLNPCLTFQLLLSIYILCYFSEWCPIWLSPPPFPVLFCSFWASHHIVNPKFLSLFRIRSLVSLFLPKVYKWREISYSSLFWGGWREEGEEAQEKLADVPLSFCDF